LVKKLKSSDWLKIQLARLQKALNEQKQEHLC